MEFNDIKKEVEEIYSNKIFPTREIAFSQDMRMMPIPEIVLGNVKLGRGTEKLLEEKGLENDIEALVPKYWNFGVNIYNNFSGEINGIKSLLEERKRELEKAYYHITQVIKNLFIKQKEGEIFYKNQKDAYLSMITNLCYLQIYLFEEEFDEYPELKKSINDRAIITSKDIILKRLDIINKLDGIKNVLYYTLFSFENNMPRKVEKWAKLKQRHKEDLRKPFRNEKAQEIADRSKEIKEKYDPEIMKEAKDFFAENGDKCITASGNASSYFYKAIHRKLEPIIEDEKVIEPPSIATVKNRLNSFLNRGILK